MIEILSDKMANRDIIDYWKRKKDRLKNHIGDKLDIPRCEITGRSFWKEEIIQIPVKVETVYIGPDKRSFDRYKCYNVSAKALENLGEKDLVERVRYEVLAKGLVRPKNLLSKKEMISMKPDWGYIDSRGRVYSFKEYEKRKK